MAQNLHRWAVLHANDTRKPVLLYSFVTSVDNGYQLHLTDCIDVWCESLSAQAIRDRAVRSACSIDPSSDVTQLQVILDKLHNAVHGEAGTSLIIDDDANVNELSMHIKSDLPAPLKPFKWKLILQPEHNRDYLRRNLIAPLAQMVLLQHAHVQQLLQASSDKDKAVARLLDKTESLGLNASEVFPTAVRARPGTKVSREQIVQQVPALRPMTAQDLMPTSHSEYPDLENLFKQLDQLTPNQSKPDRTTSGPAAVVACPHAGRTVKPESATRSEDEKDFGIVSTPPGAAGASFAHRPLSLSDNITSKPHANGHTGNNPSPSSDSMQKKPLPRKRLGGIGGRKHPVKSPSPDPGLNSDHEEPDRSPRPPSDDKSSDPPLHAVEKSSVKNKASSELEQISAHVKKEPAIVPGPASEEALEEQRANEKRDALKRQMGTQGKPGKKKRRF